MADQIQNTLFLKLIFSLSFFLLILERVQNTFSNSLSRSSKGRIHQKWLFYVLLFFYLSIVALNYMVFFTRVCLDVGISMVGVGLLALGIVFRRIAIMTLGEYWSVFIEIKEAHAVIKDGIYKYVKHPYYLAVILELTGFSLICNSWIGIVLTFCLQFPLLIYRSIYEERLLKIYTVQQKSFL